jgi:hypothetical protein
MNTDTNVSAKTITLISIVLAVAAFLIVNPVLAQEDASSTAPADDSSTTTDTTLGESTSTQSDTAISEATTSDSSTDAAIETTETSSDKSTSGADDSSSATDTSTTPAADSASDTSGSKTPAEQPPVGLTEVHIIGMKYIDYFTDGATTVEFPGDPDIDSHLSEKDAPIPTREGLTWRQTIGNYLYDTSSGDLEASQYAIQSDGKIIAKYPPFVSSTSTPATGDLDSDIATPTNTTNTSDGSTDASNANENASSTTATVSANPTTDLSNTDESSPPPSTDPTSSPAQSDQ